ncbi:MAG: hypothetical protein L0H94_06645 [Nitrospira sp.]|nr:hypothetical protein [Nitrospira sp.]
MMGTKNTSFGRIFLTSLAVLLLTFSVACSFTGTEAEVARFCSEFEDLLLTEVSQGPLLNVFENPGMIKVIHGSGTAIHDFVRDDPNFIKVEQSVEIPDYANKATVFLNGWKSTYLGDDDQNVVGIGTLVGRIRLVDIRPGGRKLTWNAVGLLRDNDAKESYEWTYYYTVIAWNDAALNVIVNHDDADNFCKAGTGSSDNFYFAKNRTTTTALSSFSSFLQNFNFPLRGTVAILPRGFGFAYDNDNNLLQLAYNLDHSENFLEYGKKYQKAFEDVSAPLPPLISLANSGFVSWNTYSILKDNDLRRDYTFGEMVSALGGNDVGLLQPPFSILPRGSGANVCQGERGGVKTEDFVIENIPFEYAVPMLTGWDLQYPCDDENVKEIGIWIDKWSYSKDPTTPTGRLSYTLSSVLRDRDDDPGHKRSHKVTILGLRSTAGETRK